MITEVAFSKPEFAGLHFTGSTSVFTMLNKRIADNMSIYKSYPKIVGETGGKNMHFVHKSAVSCLDGVNFVGCCKCGLPDN